MSVTNTTAKLTVAATTAMASAKASCNPAAYANDVKTDFERARKLYLNEVTGVFTTVVPGSTATFAAFFAAVPTVVDGKVYQLTTTVDTTDTAHTTAKGSALVAGDVFQRAGAATVYVGRQTDVTGLDAILAF